VSRIHDISRPLGPGVWTWPDDTPFGTGLARRIAEGATVNVGRLTMSCHTGTHLDAPYHFAASGATTSAIPLAHCVGPCEVLPLARLATSVLDRVLVRAEGGAPSRAQLEALGRPLKLFGTDFHSVDPLDSKTLEAHHCLWTMGAVILEELDLSGVPDGRYTLIALPIKLEGMDAAPARAVLLEEA
jgi:arylformamidase